MGLRSGQVAEAAGVNMQTLRYYERRGLLAEPQRTLGGHRLYPPEAVTLVRVIKAAQSLGFSLDEVAELLKAGHHHTDGPHQAHHRPGRQHSDVDLHQRAQVKLAEVQAKIADLTVIANTLRAAITAGCDDLIACAATPNCPLPFADLADANLRDQSA
ncbi:MerR family transcriptional regulator [Nonomuraea sp. B19D2]|uniref:MerR family transcriptional regulator n=1 Tax=Nonomuraea sp. B19D2 TaxID=3159561 RepID=UPI0032D9F6B4